MLDIVLLKQTLQENQLENIISQYADMCNMNILSEMFIKDILSLRWCQM